MAKKIFDVAVATGKYMKDGVEKTRWLNCGVVLKNDNGNYSLKLEAMPLGAEFDGWFNLFTPQPRQQQQQPSPPPPAPDVFDDDIPF